jgi:hypothetical protein
MIIKAERPRLWVIANFLRLRVFLLSSLNNISTLSKKKRPK